MTMFDKISRTYINRALQENRIFFFFLIFFTNISEIGPSGNLLEKKSSVVRLFAIKFLTVKFPLLSHSTKKISIHCKESHHRKFNYGSLTIENSMIENLATERVI